MAHKMTPAHLPVALLPAVARNRQGLEEVMQQARAEVQEKQQALQALVQNPRCRLRGRRGGRQQTPAGSRQQQGCAGMSLALELFCVVCFSVMHSVIC
jgi:hypothetical protein